MLDKFNIHKAGYEEIIEYLFNSLSNFSKTGKIKKYDLSNITQFVTYLNNPHLKYKTIHVAGTNGKGSVSSILSSILKVAGYNVGLYTSPHLYDFRERIRINGEQISKDYVSSFVKDNIDTINGLQLSFFEVTVAMAFKYFADNKVDIGVIETGLGGAFDSTNIIKPILSIITNISHDHKQYLGNTIKNIAQAKAGIIKYKTPIVVGKYSRYYCDFFNKKAICENSNLYYADKDYKLAFIDANKGKLQILRQPANSHYSHITTDLRGIYQEENIATVLKSVDILNDSKFIKINQSAVTTALQSVCKLSGLQARWQIVCKKPKIVLDVAHNIAGIKKLLSQLEKEKYDNLSIIINMMKDKSINSILKLLPKNATYYFPTIDYKRALSNREVYNKALKQGLNAFCCSDLCEAITKAKKQANNSDLILICGSFFLLKDYH